MRGPVFLSILTVFATLTLANPDTARAHLTYVIELTEAREVALERCPPLQPQALPAGARVVLQTCLEIPPHLAGFTKRFAHALEGRAGFAGTYQGSFANSERYAYQTPEGMLYLAYVIAGNRVGMTYFTLDAAQGPRPGFQ